MLPGDGRSVAEDFRDSPDVPFTQVARRVFEIVDNPAYRPPAPPPPRWSPPEKVDIRRLPVTDTELFGRGSELAMLDEAWAAGGTHVVSLVAWGGVGKTTLVNKWLERLAADNYRGARRVFGWSFYSQGTGERVTSADLFINEALGWFGDPDPTQGSPWDKGQRLADLVRGGKNLLVLDGLEPLQSDLAYERGKVKDPGLGILLAELARRNPGLCVITTREPVADLAAFPESTRQEDLERISAEAGAGAAAGGRRARRRRRIGAGGARLRPQRPGAEPAGRLPARSSGASRLGRSSDPRSGRARGEGQTCPPGHGRVRAALRRRPGSRVCCASWGCSTALPSAPRSTPWPRPRPSRA